MSFLRFVTMHAFDGRTDGQTDRILIARPRLHSMQRGKNVAIANALQLEGYYAVQLHPKSPSLVPIESSYATSY